MWVQRSLSINSPQTTASMMPPEPMLPLSAHAPVHGRDVGCKRQRMHVRSACALASLLGQWPARTTALVLVEPSVCNHVQPPIIIVVSESKRVATVHHGRRLLLKSDAGSFCAGAFRVRRGSRLEDPDTAYRAGGRAIGHEKVTRVGRGSRYRLLDAWEIEATRAILAASTVAARRGSNHLGPRKPGHHGWDALNHFLTTNTPTMACGGSRWQQTRDTGWAVTWV